MRNFPWWRALWLSFFSRTLYQSVARQWQGVGSLYLFIVSALVMMPLAIQIHEGYVSFVKQELPAYLDELPEITIENGQASTPEDRPYVINEKGTTDPFIVVDTSGQYNTLDQTSAAVLITADRIFVRKDDVSSQSYPFADFVDMKIDRSLVEAFLKVLGRFILPFTYFILVAMAWFWRFSQAMTYAFLASWLAKRQGLALRYHSFVRISAVALTPAIIIDTFIGLFGLPLPFAGVLFLILEIMYIRFAVQSICQLPPNQRDDEGSIIA
ncbi:DUF1189 domain-containing protein [Tolumonas lignilytica]|uniref:DUF1189 domain-containing protein n=1 Tax=Tolumonas lignilytica TaxID=1283284 RepID=UPI0009DFF918|nr:DUF1189 domain-containing protein [Tolumonas lignilytica]